MLLIGRSASGLHYLISCHDSMRTIGSAATHISPNRGFEHLVRAANAKRFGAKREDAGAGVRSAAAIG